MYLELRFSLNNIDRRTNAKRIKHYSIMYKLRMRTLNDLFLKNNTHIKIDISKLN